MKKDIYEYLIFKLDSECADFEFDLIPIPPFEFIENDLSLEPYEYFGETVEIFNLIPKQILLYFNADILMRVIITFKGNVEFHLKKGLENSSHYLPEDMLITMIYDKGFKLTVLKYQKRILGKT